MSNLPTPAKPFASRSIPRRSILLVGASALLVAATRTSAVRALPVRLPPRTDHYDFSLTLPDGVILKADLYQPNGGGKRPVMLIRTPYDKHAGMLAMADSVMDVETLLNAGFAVVIQDVRGTGASGGDFVPLFNEEKDGAATLRWIAAQDWCNGEIRTIGASYLGFTQFAMAVAPGVPLDGCVYVNTAPDAYRGWYYSNGGPYAIENSDRYGYMIAATVSARKGDAARSDAVKALATNDTKRLLGPLSRTTDLVQPESPWYRDLVGHPLRDEYWKDISYSDRLGNVRSEGLHVGGWFDFFSSSTVEAYETLRDKGADAKVREGQYLVMGPWTHIDMSGLYAVHDFGPESGAIQLGLKTLIADFLSKPPAERMLPRATYFLMGTNEWRTADAFPPPGTTLQALSLGLDAKGETVLAKGKATSASRSIPVDPANPVPTLGGRLLLPGDTWTVAGPADQRLAEKRDDVLSFTTEPFVERMDVVGRLMLTATVSTDMADADLAVVVTDVAPDGTSRYLCDGIGRLSQREALDRRSPVVARQAYPLTVDLGVTANAFLPGHRLRVNLAGSNFPNYDINRAIEGKGSLTIHLGAKGTTLTIPVSRKA